jgi:LysR family transcriptional regulator, regulator for genes of the gallate degradation pathway
MPVSFFNIRHLRVFMEVAARQGISAAAARVHLSQPAVTQAIAGLERHLRTRLFDRRPEGMFTTETGAALLLRVQRLFRILEQGAETCRRVAGRRAGAAGTGFHMRVTAPQLRALVAIWECGDFSLAARDIGISQPSVHRAARDLEKLAGMAFFTASRNGIELTPQAEAFARAVKLAAAELRQGFDEIARLGGQDSSRIVVGSMPLSRTSILPTAIHALLQDGGAIQLRSVDGPYGELLKGLRLGDLDVLIGALRDPVPTDDVIQETLLQDPLAIVVSPGHPLAGQGGLTLADTLAYPWIAPPRTTPAGNYLYRVLGIGALGQTPVRIVASSLVLVRGLLARGDYVTILSLHQAALEHAQGLMVPLDLVLPDSTRPIGLTYRKTWSPTPTQARFLGLIRAAARAPVPPAYTQNE